MTSNQRGGFRRLPAWPALLLLLAGYPMLPVVAQPADARRVHDPSALIACDGKFWVFSTGHGIRTHWTSNLVEWTEGSRVFASRLDWWDAAAPGWDGQLWAPDIVRMAGRYRLYYSISVFGKKTSAIGLAENATLDPDAPGFSWRDRGIVVRSGERENYNTIDPCVFEDLQRRIWMVFGSYWTGIKLVELDRESGLCKVPGSPPISLAAAPSPATDIEAAYIHPHGGWYYLFVNRGQCCRGTNSTYEVRVGRSREVTGPYLDREGRPMSAGGGTVFLRSHGRHIGPGHVSILEREGLESLSYHFYDAAHRGRPRLRIVRLERDAEGWPVAGEVTLGGTEERN